MFEGKEKRGGQNCVQGGIAEFPAALEVWRNKGYENGCFMMIEWEPVRTVSGHLSQRPCD